MGATDINRESAAGLARHRNLVRYAFRSEDQGDDSGQIVQGASNRLRWAVIGVVILIVVGVSAAIFLQSGSSSGLMMSASGNVSESNSASVVVNILLSLHNTTHNNMTFYGGSYNLSQNGVNLQGGLFNNNVNIPAGQTKVANETVTIDLGDTVFSTPITAQGVWRLQGSASVEVAGANQTQGYDLNFATH